MMRAEGNSSTIILVASTPPITGMLRSIRITSGEQRRNISTAAAPLSASPTSSRSGCIASIADNPSRKIGWSSTVMTRRRPLSGMGSAWALRTVGGMRNTDAERQTGTILRSASLPEPCEMRTVTTTLRPGARVAAWRVLLASALTSPIQSQYLRAPGGRQYQLDAWRAQDGVRLAFTSNLVQTREGYLWLSTQSGLTRFDGFRFRVFDNVNTPVLRGRPNL